MPDSFVSTSLARKLAVPLSKAYRLLNHGPTILVSAAHAGRSNVMAAAWNMPLDFQPPKVAVVIDKQTFTRGLIEASGEFVISVPPASMVEAVVKAGQLSGRDVDDKLPACGLGGQPASSMAAPLIEGCMAWLECRVLPEPTMVERYDLYLAEVVAAWADPLVFSDGRWHMSDKDDAACSLHHVAGRAFFATGKPVSAASG
ncbi:MAG: flavin reductase family protein [Aquabacterium sp.]